MWWQRKMNTEIDTGEGLSVEQEERGTSAVTSPGWITSRAARTLLCERLCRPGISPAEGTNVPSIASAFAKIASLREILLKVHSELQPHCIHLGLLKRRPLLFSYVVQSHQTLLPFEVLCFA